MAQAAVFVFALIDDCFLLFLAVYFIIELSDLESDHINATTCCTRLNRWLLPEALAQLLTTVMLLLSFELMFLIFTLPMTIFLVRRIITSRRGHLGYYDPTEIYNRGLLKSHIKESMIKMAYYLFGFFIFLFRLEPKLLHLD
ncbi:uncharacterized protein TRIADDRAFT_32218 [Trichoplax adhaerens]|uniref:Protein cornichon homolog 4 n=1 Tax=Trichoplax adhaerens TaxID=10228 RepID=B3SAD0_TRIAD|nr:hypothetical protein TRIADDRAFT_32218 [Trichoplax adhaerens]EDV20235.1 hypothetical protein TRIADDRAFT_32218 [Trichoplax adhaerens]|eukprot:XP_002117185.1 hypothetical protein TRIADDRAFT_32218 [Trichoplax adhaerens]